MKRALVLSGGGFFGAYQAGAWKAIAPHFDPDIVAGASAGSMNAWAIAGGATPDELIEHWLTLKLTGIRDFPANLKHDFPRYKRQKEVGVSICRLPFLKHELVTNDDVTERHILASCAVPPVFPPVRIGAHWYVDGGLVEALPIWAAIQMGATDIIGVNVWSAPRTYVKTVVPLIRAMAGHKGYNDAPLPAGVRLRLINPETSLWQTGNPWKYRRAEIAARIAHGERDAMNVLDR